MRATDSLALALQHHRAGRADEAEKTYLAVLKAAPEDTSALLNLGALVAAQERFEEAEQYYKRSAELEPADAAVRSNLGNLMQTQNRLEEAVDYYRAALDLDPRLAEAHVNLGNLYLSKGELEKAVESLSRGVDINPRIAHAHSALGAALAGLDRTADAVAAFTTAAEHDPRSAQVHDNLAGVLFNNGDYKGAAESYRHSISIDPNNAAVHCNFGTVLEKLAKQDEAIDHFRKVVALDPDHFGALTHLARLLTGTGEYEEAEERLARCKELRPDDVEVAFHYGNLCLAKKEAEQAITHFEHALTLHGDISEAYNNLGNALQSLDRQDEAIEALNKAIEVNPESAHAWNNLGNSYAALKKQEEALDAYRRAAEIDPKLDVAMINLGNVLRAMDRLDEALQWFEKALQKNPALYSAYNGIGLSYQAYNEHEKAIDAFEKAVEIKPHYAHALNNLAISYQDTGQHAKAIKAYQDILDNHPELTEVYFNLGTLLQLMSRFDESVVVFKKALSQREHYDVVYPYLAHGLMQQCSWTNLDAIISKVLTNAELQVIRGEEVAVSAFGLQSLPATPELKLGAARQISKRAQEKVEEQKKARPPYKFRRRRGKKITVGFMSPDFRFHSVAVAFKSVLGARNTDRFEYQAYAITTYGEDGLTSFFQATFDKYIDITNMTHTKAADTIHGNGVDILVDLAGHTRGGRYEVFAFRPAPIQAHWLGFSSTTGADYIDYLITDKIQLPPEDQKYCSEKLVYLPDTFMATSQHEHIAEPVSRVEAGLPEEGFVFANFNSHYKFYPTMFDIWMRLLRQVPGSLIWFMGGTKTSRKNLRLEAKKRGVDPARLCFANTILHPNHLARIHHVDLCLDNLFHGGGVTTTDALWVGVPVLTLWGDAPPARNGASLVSAIGAPELTTYSMTEYESKALSLARNPAELAALKAKLQANRDTHPLFDIGRLTGHLESGFELMMENYLAGNPPRTIEVPALPVRHGAAREDDRPDHLLKDAV
ncbi:MAG: tetratricopeptide repeat protein [Proteobacteria bacterium]|nr:tetratricopeptide repeat protein [Pseudomonadota bacterium]